MCGLFGVITPNKPVNMKSCFQAIQSLTHRGPDGLGVVAGTTSSQSLKFYLNPSLGQLREEYGGEADFFFGHRRLSVIDLSSKAFQPLGNEDGRIWVVFNGEIYNHLELRRDLESRGHLFATNHSDTEVLVHGYEEWGPRILDRLCGMFAFVVADFISRQLFLARDRFGEKPLYLAAVEGGLAFASEIKSFNAGNFLSKSISIPGLCDYLRFKYIPAPRTIYSDVAKIKPAECITIDFNVLDRWQRFIYWELSYTSNSFETYESWLEQFEDILSESVRIRMPSDVPIGAFLSGGMDSTMIVREMVRNSGNQQKTFNISFPVRKYDESRYAESAASYYGTEHYSRPVTPEDLRRLLPSMSVIFDEPFADSSALPTMALVEFTKESVTVALSGDGGDELLVGYPRYSLNDRLSKIFDNFWGASLSKFLLPIISFWPEKVRGRGLVKLLRFDARARYEQIMGDAWLLEQSTLIREGKQFDFHSVWDEETCPLINRMCKADVNLYIPEDTMVKVDRTSMAASLESRAPLLDHRLFEFIANSPLEYRFNGGFGKLPFRTILASELGPAFINRPKQGFEVPLGPWFRKELRKDLEEQLCQNNSFVSSIFPRGFIKRLIQAHISGTRDQSNRIWILWVLELWNRKYGGIL